MESNKFIRNHRENIRKSYEIKAFSGSKSPLLAERAAHLTAFHSPLWIGRVPWCWKSGNLGEMELRTVVANGS